MGWNGGEWGSCLATVLLLACARRQPVCPQSAGCSRVNYPATEEGQTIADYVRAFNTGDPGVMHSFGERHRSAEVAIPPERAMREGFAKMMSALGCLEPRQISDTAEGVTLLVHTAREDWYDLTFSFDREHKLSNVHGSPSLPPDEKRPVSDADVAAAIDAYASELTARQRFSGVVLLAKSGKPFLERAFGLADRNANLANRTDTKFNIGSIGKMFTGVAVAQLVEQGKLKYSDSIRKYLPDYPEPAASKVTLHQLLTNTKAAWETSTASRSVATG